MADLTVDQAFQISLRHHQAGQLEEAERLYREVLARQPNHADALHLLGVVLHQSGQRALAEQSIRQAIATRPDFPEAWVNLGTVLQADGRLDEAIASQRRAIALQRDNPQAWYNLGNALKTAGNLKEAITSYRRAIALKPDYRKAHYNLGVALDDNGRVDRAVTSYRRAIALDPDFADAHHNLALSLLSLGNLPGGWEEWEWRWKCRDFPSPRRNFQQPLWDGRPLAGSTLLLHAEQGFGDTLQFIRYLPLVARMAGKTVVECQAEVQRLIQPIAGKSVIVARGQPLPPFDVHCPLLSVPRLFGTTLQNIPRPIPYLQADVETAGKWHQRLAGVANSIKVGIAWAGSRTHRNDRNRSMHLRDLTSVLGMPGVSFFSLQKGASAQQLKELPEESNVTDLAPQLNDFADTAGVISNLDLVISVDTAVAHLAGAMGKPAWVLLPAVPDWRWLLQREDSPWYATLRLFRQPRIGAWESVVKRVGEALAQVAIAQSASRPRH